MARRALLLVVLVAVCARALPVDPAAQPSEGVEATRRLQGGAPAPPKTKSSGFSLWSAAKRFFTSREKMKSKMSGSVTTGVNPIMPSKYGVSFKSMLTWWCLKPENKEKSNCKLHAAGKVTDTVLAQQLRSPSLTESKDAFKAYCGLKENKSKLICIQSKVVAATQAAVASKTKAIKAAAAKAAVVQSASATAATPTA